MRYVSYAAARPRAELPLLLRLISGAIVEENDGIVAVSSAKWGEYRGVLRADHLELIGWSLRWPNPRVGRPFDHLGFWHDTVGEWFGG